MTNMKKLFMLVVCMFLIALSSCSNQNSISQNEGVVIFEGEPFLEGNSGECRWVTLYTISWTDSYHVEKRVWASKLVQYDKYFTITYVEKGHSYTTDACYSNNIMGWYFIGNFDD